MNDTLDPNAVDELPRTDINPLVTIRGAGGAQPGPFQIGFDINGQATRHARPGRVSPTASRSATLTRPAIQRWVILFNDGTVKVQNNDNAGAYCP